MKIFGKINDELQIETVTQTYYEEDCMGVSIHISGKREVVEDLMRDVSKIAVQRLAIEKLKKRD